MPCFGRAIRQGNKLGPKVTWNLFVSPSRWALLKAWPLPQRVTLGSQAPGAVMLIGVISDTHSLLRPEAVSALTGVDAIIHAGDVGHPGILDELGRIAPVSAVRGNVDTGIWADCLPESLELRFEGVPLFVIHDRGVLTPSHRHLKSRAVIFGHSHQPLADERNGILWLNPGSAGPRRFRLPVSLARLEITPSGEAVPHIIDLTLSR